MADWIWVTGFAAVAFLLNQQDGLAVDAGLNRLWTPLLLFLAVIYLTVFPALIRAGAYRMPRKWHAPEAFPVIVKAFLVAMPVGVCALLLLSGLSYPYADLEPRKFVFVGLLAWGGLIPGLIGIRLLAGHLQPMLYGHESLRRRSVIVGSAKDAIDLAGRIENNAWLGEEIVGYVGSDSCPGRLGDMDDLPSIVQTRQIDVVWLAPTDDREAEIRLPALLFAPDGSGLIWRMLPRHYQRLQAENTGSLAESQRALLERRLERRLALPLLHVVMLGSRGIPAQYGGVERYVEEVGSCLAADGAEVVVYCHRKYVAASGCHRGITLRFVPSIPSKHLETITHTFLATLHALLHEEAIFHYHALGPSTLAWLPRLLGRKIIVTVQGLDWQRDKWGRAARSYLKIGERTALYFAHRTIVVSKELEEFYMEKYSRPVFYIPNGFASPQPKLPEHIRRLGLEQDNFILFVGRLVPEKGCHVLLQAFAEIESDKRLVIAGQATYEDAYYQRLLDIADGRGNIQFVGFADDPLLTELYSNAYMVVHPSSLEGLSISLLESLSYGNCLLVSDTPENLEVMREIGYTFETGNEIDLREKLEWLLVHPEKVAAMRAKTKANLGAHLDWQAVTDSTREIYSTL